MKIASTAILFAAAIGATSAKNTSVLRRDRNLQDAIDTSVEADKKGNKSGEPFDGDLGAITSLSGDCVYDFDDEDMFEVLTGSPDAMTCLGERCNLSLASNRVIGVNFEEFDDDSLAAYFNVNCPTRRTKFGLSCPPGYNVEKLYWTYLTITGPPEVAFDCSNSPDDATEHFASGNYCTVLLTGVPDTQLKFKYMCLKSDHSLDVNWD